MGEPVGRPYVRLMDSLALIITSTTQPGRRDDVHQLYRELMAPRAEENEAQRLVVWCDDQQDPDRFHLFEIYSDPSVMQENATSPWFAAYMEQAGPLLAGQPSVTMAVPRWSTGLS